MPIFRNPFSKKNRGSLSRSKNLKKKPKLELLEERRVMTAVPFGATELDLGEFLLGDVAVTPVFFESNGTQDTSTEDWDANEIQETLGKIDEGLAWWENTLAAQNTVHELNFTVDDTFATAPFSSRYEPINRRSNDYVLYVREFLDSQGFSTGSIDADIRSFNHSQREKHDTNWSFTMIVVPSYSDADGMFAPGGSFRQAFAFAGGLFMVVPSARPASTFAHELGHIFWGRDEYPGGGSYFDRRGYYNTQNLNAHNNPEPGFVQQPSIMAAGDLLQTAYANNVSAPSTFAMVGWQDSDGDGIFDVLDVPHSLTGTGHLDVANSQYRFQGQAAVQTLPNLNPSGLKNDITINRIREIEFRFDNGPWQVHSLPDAYEVELDLTINVPSGAQQIEIRARDSKTTVTSNVFSGRLDRAEATLVPGINGTVWIDGNKNGLRDVGEYGPELFTVQLVDNGGAPIQLRTTIEPDDFPDGQLTTGFSDKLTLTTNGISGDGRVGVFPGSLTSTGSKNFRGFSRGTQSYTSSWSPTLRLQADFNEPTSVVSIDAIGTSNQTFGRMEAFNSAGQLVGRYTTKQLGLGEVETLTIARGRADIAYVIVGGHANTSVSLDFLRFGPEAQVTTGSLGEYSFASLPAGTYNVRVTPPSGHVAIDPMSGQTMVTVEANTASADIDFGFQVTNSPWQNPMNKYDVHPDEVVSALDVLIIVNDINENKARDLTGTNTPTPPFLDVSGDNFVSALDVLMVVNHINSNGGEGESYAPPINSGESASVFGPSNSSGETGLIGEGEQVVSIPTAAQTFGPVLPESGWTWVTEANTAISDADEEEDLLQILAQEAAIRTTL